ncbi:MAG: hypothetical protein KAW09_04985, partial [Thermoplasmata archaeon]|nr:hypothetical protein [Thermoplasmata archaeon]
RCPIFPPARVVRVVPSEFTNPNIVIDFLRPVTASTPGDMEEARFRGLRIAAIRGHGRDDRIERLLEKKPDPWYLDIDMWKLQENVDYRTAKMMRRGIELEEWAMGSGEVRMYRIGKRFRPKFKDHSRWTRKLNWMKAREI